MQTKWYLIFVLTVVFAASVISISFADEDASDEEEEELADEDVSAQDHSIAPAGKPAPIACDPPCDEGWVCKRGACIEDKKACDDGNPCTTGDRMVKGKCQGTPITDGTECTDDIGNTGECSNGQCVVDCGDGQQYCDGGCINENDPNNCFGCGNVCTGNEICDAVNYDPTEPACVDCSATGKTACTVSEDPIIKTCIDTSSDTYNCGSCGHVCDGPDCCSGTCTDTLTDESNCGECGITCGDTESCVDGFCVSSYCTDSALPDLCTWTVNGVVSTVCCDYSVTTCKLGFGGDDSWYDKAVCCPEDQFFGSYGCCPEGTHEYVSPIYGWSACERDSCINNVQDPGEGGIDCGGDPDFGTGCYERCVNGQTCTGDNDCASYYCNEGTCIPCPGSCHDEGFTCTDGVCEYT